MAKVSMLPTKRIPNEQCFYLFAFNDSVWIEKLAIFWLNFLNDADGNFIDTEYVVWNPKKKQ